MKGQFPKPLLMPVSSLLPIAAVIEELCALALILSLFLLQLRLFCGPGQEAEEMSHFWGHKNLHLLDEKVGPREKVWGGRHLCNLRLLEYENSLWPIRNNSNKNQSKKPHKHNVHSNCWFPRLQSELIHGSCCSMHYKKCDIVSLWCTQHLKKKKVLWSWIVLLQFPGWVLSQNSQVTSIERMLSEPVTSHLVKAPRGTMISKWHPGHDTGALNIPWGFPWVPPEHW